MNNKVIILASIALIWSACHSKKTAQKSNAFQLANDSILNVNAIDSLIGIGMKDWTYFASKAEVTYKNGQSEMKLNAHFRMYKDSLIWISAGIVGIEGARILITKDSAAMINKLEKKYAIYHKDSLSQLLQIPVQIQELQKLILANPIYALNLYKFLLPDSMQIQLKYESKPMNVVHYYNKKFLYIDSTSINDNFSKNYITLSYSNYGEYNGHNFPINSNIFIQNGSKSIEIIMEHTNIDFTSELSFPFKIPNTYDKY